VLAVVAVAEMTSPASRKSGERVSTNATEELDGMARASNMLNVLAPSFLCINMFLLVESVLDKITA